MSRDSTSISYCSICEIDLKNFVDLFNTSDQFWPTLDFNSKPHQKVRYHSVPLIKQLVCLSFSLTPKRGLGLHFSKSLTWPSPVFLDTLICGTSENYQFNFFICVNYYIKLKQPNWKKSNCKPIKSKPFLSLSNLFKM